MVFSNVGFYLIHLGKLIYIPIQYEVVYLRISVLELVEISQLPHLTNLSL